MAYATLQDFLAYRTFTSDEDNARIGLLLQQAQAMIDTYCRRTFEWSGAAVARYFHAIDDVSDRRLWLDRDCIAVTAVVNGDGQALSSSAYTLEPRNYAADGVPIRSILLKRSAGVRWTYDDDPDGAIAVTGKWAYSETAPDDIRQVMLRLTSFLYDVRRNSGEIDRAVSLGGGVTLLPGSLPRDIRDTLELYKKRSVRY